MKYITTLFIVMTIMLYSCSNAKANTAQKENNQECQSKWEVGIFVCSLLKDADGSRQNAETVGNHNSVIGYRDIF